MRNPNLKRLTESCWVSGNEVVEVEPPKVLHESLQWLKEDSNGKQRRFFKFPVSKVNTKEDPNLNGRVYNDQLWENVINKQQSVWKGGCGLADHPEGEGSFKDQAIVWLDAMKEGKTVYGIGTFIGEYGRMAEDIIDVGGRIGFSSSGFGEFLEDSVTVNPDTYEIERLADLVLDPSQQVYGSSDNEVSWKPKKSAQHESVEKKQKPLNEETDMKEFTDQVKAAGIADEDALDGFIAEFLKDFEGDDEAYDKEVAKLKRAAKSTLKLGENKMFGAINEKDEEELKKKDEAVLNEEDTEEQDDEAEDQDEGADEGDGEEEEEGDEAAEEISEGKQAVMEEISTELIQHYFEQKINVIASTKDPLDRLNICEVTLNKANEYESKDFKEIKEKLKTLYKEAVASVDNIVKNGQVLDEANLSAEELIEAKALAESYEKDLDQVLEENKALKEEKAKLMKEAERANRSVDRFSEFRTNYKEAFDNLDKRYRKVVAAYKDLKNSYTQLSEEFDVVVVKNRTLNAKIKKLNEAARVAYKDGLTKDTKIKAMAKRNASLKRDLDEAIESYTKAAEIDNKFYSDIGQFHENLSKEVAIDTRLTARDQRDSLKDFLEDL